MEKIVFSKSLGKKIEQEDKIKRPGGWQVNSQSVFTQGSWCQGLSYEKNPSSYHKTQDLLSVKK